MIPSVECVNLDLHDRAEKAEAEVARLREALGGLHGYLAAELMEGCECSGCKLARRALSVLSDTADDWLAQHDAEVRAQERERCQWVALEHNAPELIEAARIIAAAIGEGE